ncbi:MAG TPA: hypothetical protein VL916_18670, partial [Ilumatobacteraceae bacterium]|nr:hypothetical protein [Ilumatobacteraceae bacterium]
MKEIDTSVLFQPWALAEGVAASNATVGAVLSMLIGETSADAAFPASSTQPPVADCPAASAESTSDGSHDATPERPSVAAKATVT